MKKAREFRSMKNKFDVMADSIDPGELHQKIEINFLVMMKALQDGVILQMLGNDLKLKPGFFNPGSYPDSTVKGVNEQLEALQSLSYAYSCFSKGCEYRSDL